MKKLLAIILAVVMIAACSITAFAGDSNPYADLVNTTTAVKFNDIDWYVIADDSSAANAGTVTLLAKDPIAKNKFHDSSNAYSGSAVKDYLDNLTTGSETFAGVADAIVGVDLADVGVEGAKLWLLSTSEASSLSADVRTCSTDKGVVWWLRSPGVSAGYTADVICKDGSVRGTGGSSVALEYGVRPALQLDLSKVTFDSATKTFTVGAAPESGNTTDVSYDVQPSYTVDIPAAVTLGDSAVEADITASDVLLESGKQVAVELTSASNTESGSTFNAKNGDSTVAYTITADSTVAVGDTVATFTADGSKTLTFSAADKSAATTAGEHTETLTFTISA